MANTNSTSEKGHGKNVAIFNTLRTRSVSFPGFNPANSDLQPSALAATHAAALGAIAAVRAANTTYKLRVDDRTIAFKGMGKHITALGKALRASPGITKEVKADFSILARKYRGARKAAKDSAAATPPDGVQPEQISVSQVSYDSRVAHFLDIQSFLTALPTYDSNEPHLNVAGIAATATALNTANQQVTTAIANLGNERNNRDALLYAPGTGLVDIGYQLKAYVASKFDSSTPQWKQISKLTFSRN